MTKFKEYLINNRYTEELKNEIVKNNSKTKLFTEGGRIYALKNTLEEIYCIMNDISEIPKCKCSNELKIKRYSVGFQEYCSSKCSNKYKSKIVEKSKYHVKKKFFIKEELTKEILEQYINVYNVVDTNFYKMCEFKYTSEDAYLLYNNTAIPKCKLCDNNAIFKNFASGYRDHCSVQCAAASELRIKKIKETSLLKDENGMNSYDKMLISSRTNIDADGLVGYQRNTYKARKTNEESGLWTKLEDLSDKQLYTRVVGKVMNKFNTEIRKLENFDKRGHANKTGTYHLDHKFSVSEGFKNNIPPYIIGNICNLEMITSINNLVKNRKCSITKENVV